MKHTLLKERNPVERLLALVAKHGTQKEAAREVGISAVYFGDMLAGKRAPGPAVLEKLGLRRAIVEREGAK